MKIATWNVNSIAIRLEQVLTWLVETQTDVLCLQETKCVNEKFPFAEINNAGYEVAFVGQKSYNVRLRFDEPRQNLFEPNGD